MMKIMMKVLLTHKKTYAIDRTFSTLTETCCGTRLIFLLVNNLVVKLSSYWGMSFFFK